MILWEILGLYWAPLTRTYMGHWQVEVVAVRFGDIFLEDFCSQKCFAFLDSGTTTLGFSQQGKKVFNNIVSKHLANVQENNNFNNNFNNNQEGGSRICSSDSATDLHFHLANGHVVTMYAEDYMVSRKANAPCTLNSLAINSPPSYGNIIILGEPFFRRHLVVFDTHQKRVGIGKHIFGNHKKATGELAHSESEKVYHAGSGVFSPPAAGRQELEEEAPVIPISI